MSEYKEQIQRVQLATKMHYHHAVQGVQAMAILSQPNPDIGGVRAQLNSELQLLLTGALGDQLLLSISRMHDPDENLDGIPGILGLLGNDAVREAVVAPGHEKYLTSAKEKWNAVDKNTEYPELRILRNYNRGHLITKKLFANPRRPFNLFACANETFAVVEDLSLAQGNTDQGLAWHAEHWRSMGSDFWDALAQQPKFRR